MAHLARALPLAAAAAVPPRFFAQCAGAYVALTLAAVVLTRTELRLPLVHYRASRAQVNKTIQSHCSRKLLYSRSLPSC